MQSRTRAVVATLAVMTLCCAVTGAAARQMEKLGRGLVAMPLGEGKVYVGWRMLGTDPENNRIQPLSRHGHGGEPVKLKADPSRRARTTSTAAST